MLNQSIDTTTKEGRLLFTMLAAIAEFETELRSERQMEGIAKSKERGVKFGAKLKLNAEQIDQMRQKRSSGVLIKDLMNQYGISKASVYRLLSADEQSKEVASA